MAGVWVRVWPLIGLTAKRRKHGNGWRVWTFARSLDSSGSGWIKKSDLSQYLDELGINERTQRYWIKDALNVGLISEERFKVGLVYRITALEKGAYLLGCSQVGRPKEIPVQNLTGRDWAVHVWEAHEFSENGRMVSRKREREISGVPERTQRHLEKQAKIRKIANYAVPNLPKDELLDTLEAGRAAFITRRKTVAWRLPDRRFVSSDVARNPHKGRMKKSQSRLNTLCQREQGQIHPMRLFHANDKDAEHALRKAYQPDTYHRPQIQEIYSFRKDFCNHAIYQVHFA